MYKCYFKPHIVHVEDKVRYWYTNCFWLWIFCSPWEFPASVPGPQSTCHCHTSLSGCRLQTPSYLAVACCAAYRPAVKTGHTSMCLPWRPSQRGSALHFHFLPWGGPPKGEESYTFTFNPGQAFPNGKCPTLSLLTLGRPSQRGGALHFHL
jgi:hypothetical protein